jgi:hypothetical protein
MMTRRVLDAFLYDGEAWAIRLRRDELDRIGMPVIRAAVIANRSHQGDVREQVDIAALTSSALEAGADVVHLVDLSEYDDRGRGGVGSPDYQVRERRHRDGCADAVRRIAQLNDLLLVSDADEIPHAWTVAERLTSLPPGPVAVLAQRMFVWSLRWRYPGPWLGTTAIRWPGESPQDQRDLRGRSECVVIEDGGWHLSWQGDRGTRLRKLRGFSHAELADRAERLDALAAEGYDINGVKLERTDSAEEVWPGGYSETDIATIIQEGTWTGGR